MQKAVIYARVSSKEQEQSGFSIPAQIKLLKEYALKNGFNITSEFIEAETAKKTGRKQFNEMIKFLKKNKSIRTILVEKTDRLYRNLKDYIVIDDIGGLEVHLVKEATILSDNSRSQDKFMHGIRVLMAKNYIDNLSEEIRKGIKEKCEQGGYPCRAPIGYKNVIKSSGKRVIELDEERAVFVRRAFEQYAGGGYSFKTLADELRKEGFIPYKTPCTKMSIENILKNPFYIGEFDWNGKRYIGNHEPIIDKKLYYAVQSQINSHTSPKTIKHEFAYSNMIKCEECGCYLVGELKKKKYVYWHCTGNKGGDCKRIYLKEEKIDIAIINFLKRLHISNEEIKEVIDSIKTIFKMKNKYEENSLEQIEKQIKILKNRLNKLYIDKLDGLIDEDMYFKNKEEWQLKLDEFLIKYEATLKNDRTFVDNATQILELCRDALGLYLSYDNTAKRKLLNLLCSNFFFDGENIRIELKSTFEPMLKSANLVNGGG